MTREEAKEQLLGRIAALRNICEVHREIYDATKTLPDVDGQRIRELVVDAYIMGKKMDAKLRSYKADWDIGVFESNKDYCSDQLNRLGKKDT